MRFSTAFVAATALFLAPLAACDDGDDIDADIGDAPEPTPTVHVHRPDFTPTDLKAPFFEQFLDGWEKRWKTSSAKKQDKSEEDWAYIGTWAVEEPKVYKALEGDKGLVLKDRAAHHAISAKFDEPVDNKGKTLVVQYEVKLQDGLNCGGAYIKLLANNEALHAEEFSNASPYVIMFGPDKCGSQSKTHFIYRHKNPISGEYEEKHLAEHVDMKNEKTTTLYQLIIRPDQTYSININGENEQNGTFFAGFDPPIIPSKEIDDKDDTKPKDWVDEEKIPDPKAVKPDDWDEDEPESIIDPDSEKPYDWHEDVPLMIPDPDAKKPEDWDDEEDGDWVPPKIQNPKCPDGQGCGPWEPARMNNPKYKGKWEPPLINNPKYKGEWKPRKIPNPNYFTTKTPADLEPIGGIGMELWTMNPDILFDNIYIGHSIEDAEQLKKETYDIKAKIEQKIVDAEDPKAPRPDASKIKKPLINPFLWADPIGYTRMRVEDFITLAKEDVVHAIKEIPEVAGGFGLIVALLIAILAGGLGLGSQSPQVQQAAAKAKDAAANAKDKASEAVSTGADKIQSEVNKRTTRSTSSD